MADVMTGGAGDPVAEQLNLLARADDVTAYVGYAAEQAQSLQAQRDEIDRRLAEVQDSRQGLLATLDEARAEAYAWVLANNSEITTDRLCWVAARAAVLGRPVGEAAAHELQRSAQAIGRLGVGDSVLTVTRDRVSGLIARSGLGFAAHPKGLAVTFTASPSGSDAERTVVTPVDELFGGYGTKEDSPNGGIFIGENAIRGAVSDVLKRPAGPERPTAASLVLALHRAGLTLNGLEVEPYLIEAARDEIYQVATETRAFKHDAGAQKQEGYTDVVDAESWAATLLVEQPTGSDEQALRTHALMVADQLEAIFMMRLRKDGQPSADRIVTVAGRLAHIRSGDQPLNRNAVRAHVQELKELAGLL